MLNIKVWYQSLLRKKSKRAGNHFENYQLSLLPLHVLEQLETQPFDFYFVINKQGFIKYYSQSAQVFLPKQLLNKQNIYDWLHQDFHSDFSHFISHAQHDLSPSSLTINLTPENDTHSFLTCHVLHFKNCHLVTSRMVANQQLTTIPPDKERLITLGEMAAGLIHEFKNPLTSLKGFTELIKAGVPYEKEYFRVISDELSRLELLTSELLTLSKPSGEVKRKIDLQRLCDDVSLLFHHQLEKRHITLSIDGFGNIYTYGNDCQLKQVLINLVKNAMEAVYCDGSITIALRQHQSTVSISVKDTGKGISKDELAMILKPFYTTKSKGTGLGLAVSQQIIKNHHGQMTVSSTLNVGTIFTLTLPHYVEQPIEHIS